MQTPTVEIEKPSASCNCEGTDNTAGDGLWFAWLPAVVAVAAVLIHTLWPDREITGQSPHYTYFLLCVLGAYVIWAGVASALPTCRGLLARYTPLTIVGLGVLIALELVTSKWALLPLPFFPSPEKIFAGMISDAGTLGISVLYSLRLLTCGYFIGVAVGLPTGLLMGWLPSVRYWMNPIVRILGPIPAFALIPMAMVIFPTSFTASVFLLVLAAWFPVTIMTWSGVANVNKGYFDIARTLGASESFLLFKVALPAAMPMVFVGLFMGLGAIFVTLIAAEMLGVPAGLGWYIQWSLGWGEYYKVYAALAITAVLFSTLISLLFAVRDRVLVWQKGMVRW